jgi:hypothetical protein
MSASFVLAHLSLDVAWSDTDLFRRRTTPKSPPLSDPHYVLEYQSDEPVHPVLHACRRVPESAPALSEFPAEIILPVEKDELMIEVVNDPIPNLKDTDGEDFTSPFFPPSPSNLRGKDDQER